MTPVSSPIGIIFFPEATIFSTSVDPHLGTPTIKMGLTLNSFFTFDLITFAP